MVDNSGDIVLYHKNGIKMWTLNTSADCKYLVDMSTSTLKESGKLSTSQSLSVHGLNGKMTLSAVQGGSSGI